MTPEQAKSLAEAGPWTVLIFFVAVVGIVIGRTLQLLWREHLKADQDDRDQRDRAIAVVEALVPTIKQMANAWDARNRADAARRRRGDA
jgi:low temperature requirement protein LtrA